MFRLKGIKKMHDESPNLQQTINEIQEDSKTISELREKNKADVKSLKAEINREFDQILKDLEQCEKDIAALS